jgi:hypothetical protein
MSRDRIVTPYTDPDRWTPEEKAYFDQGLCSYDVAVQYWGEIDNLCGKKSKRGASFGYCTAHTDRLLENHWPDGSPRR